VKAQKNVECALTRLCAVSTRTQKGTGCASQQIPRDRLAEGAKVRLTWHRNVRPNNQAHLAGVEEGMKQAWVGLGGRFW